MMAGMDLVDIAKGLPSALRAAAKAGAQPSNEIARLRLARHQGGQEAKRLLHKPDKAIEYDSARDAGELAGKRLKRELRVSSPKPAPRPAPQAERSSPARASAAREGRARASTQTQFQQAKAQRQATESAEAKRRSDQFDRTARRAAAGVATGAAVAGGAVAVKRARQLRHLPAPGMNNAQKAVVGAGAGLTGGLLLHERNKAR